MKRSAAAFTLTSLAALMAVAPLNAPAFAQDDKDKQDARQTNKNNTRNLGYGLGAAALLQALRGKGTEAILLGAGAAYATKKAQDQQKAQDKRDQNRQVRATPPKTSGDTFRPGSYTEAAEPVAVSVDSDAIAFNDQGPEVVGGRVYVPLRGVLEKMGANVKWDATARAITATKGERVVVLPTGGQATVNGQPVSLDAPAFIAGGRTMIPLRFMAEAFGADVNYDANRRQVSINSQGKTTGA